MSTFRRNILTLSSTLKMEAVVSSRELLKFVQNYVGVASRIRTLIHNHLKVHYITGETILPNIRTLKQSCSLKMKAVIFPTPWQLSVRLHDAAPQDTIFFIVTAVAPADLINVTVITNSTCQHRFMVTPVIFYVAALMKDWPTTLSGVKHDLFRLR
jgi:hypothetical protein